MIKYERDKCERRSKHGLAATCRECKDVNGRFWCEYCLANTNLRDWAYESSGPYCTTCGSCHGCHGQGDCSGPG